MFEKCKGCGYERTQADEHVPDWECPGCGCAYNKIEKKLSEKQDSQKSKLSDQAISNSKKIGERKLYLSSFLFVLTCSLGFYIFINNPASKTVQIQKNNKGSLNEVVTSTESDNVLNKVESNIFKQEVSDKDKLSLADEVEYVQSRINSLEVEVAKYAGGLVLATLSHTLAIENQTLSMLKQKQSSWLFGIDLDYTVDGQVLELPANTSQAMIDLSQHIDELKGDIRESQREADRYSGGLIRAQILSTNATQQQTLAMLKQKKFALQYKLPQFIGYKSLVESPNQIANKVKPAIKPPAKLEFEIVSINSKITESNSTWWKFAWKLVIQNKSESTGAFSAEIEFLDSEGFIVDKDSERSMIVRSGETKTFTGYALVTAEVAVNINSTSAKVKMK